MSNTGGVSLLVLALGCAAALPAQPSKSLTDKLNDAVESTSLRSVSKPWHLKMDVTVIDSKGQEQAGNIESWRAGEESHTLISFAGSTVNEFDHADEHYRSQQGGPLPPSIEDLLDAVLHPGPQPSELAGAVPEMRTQNIGKSISGAVVLHAVIGTDGRIQRLLVMSAPGPDLAIAALQAVRTWTYKPYLLNGEPTSVDKTITVNFNLSVG